MGDLIPDAGILCAREGGGLVELGGVGRLRERERERGREEEEEAL